MQSHWKELLADQATRKKEGTETEVKAPVKKKAEKKVQAEAAEQSEAEEADEDEAEFEDEDQVSRWKTALVLFHRYRYPSLAVSLVILAISLFVAYGPDDRPYRVPVSGIVRIDGKPLTSGTILFIPEDGAHASIGAISDMGRFTLTCFDGNDGAVPGSHRMEIAPSQAPEEGDPPWTVPQKYTNCETSGLTAVISGRTDDLLVNLKTDRTASGGETGLDPLQLPPEGAKP